MSYSAPHLLLLLQRTPDRDCALPAVCCCYFRTLCLSLTQLLAALRCGVRAAGVVRAPSMMCEAFKKSSPTMASIFRAPPSPMTSLIWQSHAFLR